VRGQVLQPFKRAGRIILIFVYLDSFFILGRKITFLWKCLKINIKSVKGLKTVIWRIKTYKELDELIEYRT
jgi:hypothetical protein